ncbi:MAG: ChaN family lipoprotein, partial [Deltaproteobacteria bacterium]|nr:ChaN family lipoprotein [Deltaproteobacteria bacterium]
MKASCSQQKYSDSFLWLLTTFRNKCSINAVTLSIVILIVCLPMTGWGGNLHYALDVKIDIEEKKITGIAHLNVDGDQKVALSFGNFLKFEVDGHAVIPRDNGSISIDLKKSRETVIRYEAQFLDSDANRIDKEHVFLTNAWYPRPDVLSRYRLSVTLPGHFIANSEADKIIVRERGPNKTFFFDFRYPLDALHLAASTRYVLKKDRFKDISVETYFFKEDAALADAYIAHTKEYLAMYESMLIPYPYKRFAVVENLFPSGNSMPTYTLLGSKVVRLPFIVKTSLGHEILHQWFGNAVHIDITHGNWAEGITTYLADHHYAALKKEDAPYRKQILLNYSAYVNPDNAMPLSRFTVRRNKAESAVGYGKSAMMFHWLRKRYGDHTFFTALREFILNNLFRRASWHDIQRAFEKVTGETLYKDFAYWLTEKDIMRIGVENVELLADQGQLKLNFRIVRSYDAFPVHMPIHIISGGVQRRRFVELKGMEENMSLTLDELPEKVRIDPNYDLMRQLHPDEIPPILAGAMGRERLAVVCAPEQRPIYQTLIDGLGVENMTNLNPDDVPFNHLKGNSLLIAGYGNTFAKMLFGKRPIPEDGVHVSVHKNPHDPDELIVLLYARNRTEAEAVKGKIRHYGKYKELAFKGGKNTVKTITKTENGIPVLSRPRARVIDPGSVMTMDQIFSKLSGSRIIYVGERHDQFSHHINQLQMIKKLHEAGNTLAVGMEMFQTPYQQVLDAYIAGKIDERTFLKKSEYFKTWGYDYNLYKPIIDYLRRKKIPIVALNIEKDITRKVAREGIQGLSEDQKQQLPPSLDFSNKQYRRDLKGFFSHHAAQSEIQNHDYFYQAQTIWDEAMAESAHRYLLKNPDR